MYLYYPNCSIAVFIGHVRTPYDNLTGTGLCKSVCDISVTRYRDTHMLLTELATSSSNWVHKHDRGSGRCGHW